MQQQLLNKEKKALLKLKKELSLKYNLYWLKLFGSKARGDFDKESDIDVVIVLDNVTWEIEKQVYELCFYLGLEYDVLISPIIYSIQEINDKLTKATPLFMTVEKEGIAI
jgi:predicted nucleotidyltransferase